MRACAVVSGCGLIWLVRKVTDDLGGKLGFCIRLITMIVCLVQEEQV